MHVLNIIWRIVIIAVTIAITAFMVLTCKRARKHKISAQKAWKQIVMCFILICALSAIPFAFAQYISPEPDEPIEEDDSSAPDSFVAPYGEPIPSITSAPFAFCISEVRGSDAVDFGLEYSNGADTTFQDLLDSESSVSGYLEEHRNIGNCVPLHSAVKLVDVDADTVSFQDRAGSLEECDARAAKAYANAVNAADQSDKQEWYNLMAQAGLDGLYLSRKDSDTERRWQYAEIAFCGLVNVYIFQENNSAINSDLFYNFGQVYDHLGNILLAEKNSQLAYGMFLIAAQFYGQAYDQLKQHSFAVEGVVYTDAVCDAYGRLLYQLGLHVTEKKEFYEVAKECGELAVDYKLCGEDDLDWLYPVKDELKRISPPAAG